MLRRRAIAAAIAITALTACTPAGGHPSPIATSATVGDMLAGNTAHDRLAKLQQASGSTRILKVEVTRDDALLVVLNADNKAESWAFRGGTPQQVDGDTQYIGQATFALDDFDLTNLKALFARAATLSGSNSNQQLQIVDYYHGTVYMTVTTSPESATVFFRADQVPIPALDYGTVPGLEAGLRDVSRGQRACTQIVFSRTDGIWLDTTGANGSTRIVRPAKYPARTDVVSERHDWPSFSPQDLQPEAIQRVLTELDPDSNVNVRVEIDRRDRMAEPTMTFVGASRTVVTDLVGNEITTRVAR